MINLKNFSLLALVFITMGVANALPCEQSKSSFIDAISNDTINLVTNSDYTLGESVSIPTLVGPNNLGRSGGQVLFTAPGTGTDLQNVTVTITSSEFLATELILQFAIGPMTNNFASCSERIFVDGVISNSASNPKLFTTSDLTNNTGDTSYIFTTNAGVQESSTTKSYGVQAQIKVVPGQVYEATCGAIKEKGGLVESFNCNILIEEGKQSGGGSGDEDSDDSDDDTVEPVVLTEEQTEAVKIQPETRSDACPLSSLEHLNVAIKAEQAIKLRADRQAQELQDAIDAVSDAGVNPGPALRRLDALVEFVRDDIGETRNLVKTALEFSKRNLECAKQQLDNENIPTVDKSSASSEIDQAIVNDDEAITASMTENESITNESVRLKGTLEATSTRIGFALNDKEQAGESIDSSFTMPDFASEDLESVINEFQSNVADLGQDLIDKLNAQQSIVKDNNTNAAIDAILGVQVDDCINEFFDEVVEEYSRLHTSVREALKKIEDEAQEAASSDEPDPEAPTVREGKAAMRAVKKIDKAFVKTVAGVNKTKKRVTSTYNSGLVGTEQQRTNRKIRVLLKLLRRANLTNDKQWRRLIRIELKKLIGVKANF